MEPLYKAWNCGYKVVASAGEDAFPNFYRSYILGSNRVYVRSGATLDYDKWTVDFRAGKSFVTSGPLVLLKVNGKEPGDEIRLPAGKHTVKVEVEVKSITPVESVEVMHNGKPLGNVKTVTIERSGWISAQVKAKYTRDPIRRPYPFAATMPVWITVDGKPVRSKADAEYFVQWIDRSQAGAMRAPFNNEMERNETRKLYQDARAKMLQRVAEAGQ